MFVIHDVFSLNTTNILGTFLSSINHVLFDITSNQLYRIDLYFVTFAILLGKLETNVNEVFPIQLGVY